MMCFIRGLQSWKRIDVKIRLDFGQIRRKSETAGVLVIGDEVLKGRTHDTNSFFLAKELHNRGYKLEKIAVVSDDVATISEMLKKWSRAYRVVLTTGGIGPTHDDVTYEAVARAFDRGLYSNPMIVKMCKNFYKTDDENHPVMKLARIPIGAKLTFGTNQKTGERAIYPNISVENVFIFPGVPHLCQRMFQFASDLILPPVGSFFNDSVYFNQSENDLVLGLNRAVERFPDVAFGSYPVFFHSYYSVRIDLEAKSQLVLNEAKGFLTDTLKGVVDFDENWPNDTLSKIEKNDFLKNLFDKVLKLFEQFGSDCVYLFMDGGKNSTILFYIFGAVGQKLGVRINIVHVEKNSKASLFVQKMVRKFPADVLTMGEGNFVRFFQSNSELLLVKGTLSADGNFSEIESYFKQFRVENPLVGYTSRDIWDAIRGLSLPYCSLYDQGYSSITGEIDPRLIISGPRKDIVYYKSAYLLDD